MVIYKITNLLNGKRYIGQTIGALEKRFRHHGCPYNNCYLGKTIRKYGKENFKIESVCRANNLEELNKREENLIKLYDTLKPNGYNIALGGSNKGRVTSPMKGRKHSEETKKLMSKRSLGKRKSLGARLRMSVSAKSRIISLETRQKIAKSHTGLNHNGTKVIDLNTGKIFKSVTIAGKELGISRRSLVRWLNKYVKQSSTNSHINVAYYKRK